MLGRLFGSLRATVTAAAGPVGGRFVRVLRRSAVRQALVVGGYVVCATLSTAYLAVAGDTLARRAWRGFDWRSHLAGALGLYTAVGAALGVVAALALTAVLVLRRTVGVRHPRLVAILPAVLAGATAAYASASPLRVTLSGRVVQETVPYALPIAVGVAGLGAMSVVALLQVAVTAAARRRIWRALAAGSALVACGLGAGALDLTVMVALYASAHTVLEAVAVTLTSSGVAVVLFALARSHPAVTRIARVGAVAALGWLLVFVAVKPVRERVDRTLSHVWREPVYLGRMLLRLELAEDYLERPSAWRGALDARLQRLVRNYDIASVALNPIWDLPSNREPAKAAVKVRALRRPDLNILVFYVDTLRTDVAEDRRLMPRTVALRGESLDFRRAYSSASDTVTALPVTTGGCYGPSPCAGDLLAVCRKAKLGSTLVVARSAGLFLERLVPAFRFDEVVDIQDWDERKVKTEIWGYGADRPTAMAVSERALGWIDAHPGQRFLLWALHFDVHNWMHLDEQYLAARAAERGIQRDEADKRWRYEAAAVGVDQALDHLLRGLAARGLADRTVVLFVSDHGEGLGRSNHWVHAVFLWESLVRVPMMLRVPGIAARALDVPVGHVDLAPTLARFVDRRAGVAEYHGIDLLRLLDDDPLPDALPLLIQSWRKEEVMRVGLIPRERPYRKLVLPLESVEPELYDLDAAEADELDLDLNRGPQALGLLDALVTSPVFPRPTKPK